MPQTVKLLLWLVIPSLSYGMQSVPDSTTRQTALQSVSVQLGTTGIGVFYNRLLSSSHRLTARIGGQYIAYQQTIRLSTAPKSYILIDPDFMISVAQASLKWQPIHTSSFFVTAGVGYTWHPYLNARITSKDKLNLGGLEMTPEDVGTVDLGFRWHPVVGYLGWGFGPSFPHKRISVGFEMGVYYLSRPRVKLNYEGFLETTNIDEQVPVVERNLSNYRYLPAINITFSYSLHRR